MASTAPTIETERLVLRPTALADFDRWAELLGDDEAARYIGGVQPRPAAWRAVLTMAGAWALTGVAMFSVVEKASGLWVGRVGPWQPYAWPGTEVGWALHPDAWGKGYAVEAAAAAMDYAFAALGWTDVIHCIHPGNAASRRVAARLGSSSRGPGRMPYPFDGEPVEIWGQTRGEWDARRGRGGAGPAA